MTIAIANRKSQIANRLRYHRQVLLPQVGAEGQSRLAGAAVLLVGCGALGCVIAGQLVRAGVGELRIVDRDIVELTNLQRQILFNERDAAEQIPKAVAAARRLREANSTVRIEPLVVDLHAGNAERLAGLEGGGRRVDLILDGTDNAETRYLLNDLCVKHGIPWIYGACVGTAGRCMAIRPPRTACLRCLFPDPPGAGELPTCDTAGVLGSAAGAVASLQVTEALRILVGDPSEPRLTTLDVWTGRFKTVSMVHAKRADCPCCGKRSFVFLEDRSAGCSTSLCGRDAVQVRPARETLLDLGAITAKLQAAGQTHRTPHLVRCDLNEPAAVKLTVFPDGRAIIQGVRDVDRARSLYARFIGS